MSDPNKKAVDNENKSRYNERVEKIYPEPQFEDLPSTDDEVED
jgi:hypothetical protein